jgi:hypothetical protein
MELQIIREKLQSLKAEPPPPEAFETPWSAPQRTAVPAPAPISVPTPASSMPPNHSISLPLNGRNATPVNHAIATLKQRSGYPISPDHSAYNATNPGGTSYASHQVPLDSVAPLVQKELSRFEQQLQAVNNFGQQQALAWTNLGQIATELQYELKLRGIDDYPGLDAIATFFAQHDRATVPHVTQDSQGRLHLAYHTIDFHQAEHDAQTMAQTLRHRSQYRQSPTNQLFNPAEPTDADSLLIAVRNGWHDGVNRLRQWFHHLTHPTPKRQASRVRHPFTLLDATIWFSGAAITRVGLTLLSGSNPALWPPLVIGAILLVAFALYHTLSNHHTSSGLGYRVLLILAGFLVGGRF